MTSPVFGWIQDKPHDLIGEHPLDEQSDGYVNWCRRCGCLIFGSYESDGPNEQVQYPELAHGNAPCIPRYGKLSQTN